MLVLVAVVVAEVEGTEEDGIHGDLMKCNEVCLERTDLPRGAVVVLAQAVGRLRPRVPCAVGLGAIPYAVSASRRTESPNERWGKAKSPHENRDPGRC